MILNDLLAYFKRFLRRISGIVNDGWKWLENAVRVRCRIGGTNRECVQGLRRCKDTLELLCGVFLRFSTRIAGIVNDDCKGPENGGRVNLRIEGACRGYVQ